MHTFTKLFVFLAMALSATTALAGEPQVEVLKKTQSTWDGKPLPAYPQGQPEVTILRITIPPGAQLPEHKHPVITAGILLEGELTVIAGDRELPVSAGDAVVELVDDWHYGKNTGDSDAVILVVYAGEVDQPVTVLRE